MDNVTTEIRIVMKNGDEITRYSKDRRRWIFKEWLAAKLNQRHKGMFRVMGSVIPNGDIKPVSVNINGVERIAIEELTYHQVRRAVQRIREENNGQE